MAGPYGLTPSASTRVLLALSSLAAAVAGRKDVPPELRPFLKAVRA